MLHFDVDLSSALPKAHERFDNSRVDEEDCPPRGYPWTMRMPMALSEAFIARLCGTEGTEWLYFHYGGEDDLGGDARFVVLEGAIVMAQVAE